MRLSIYFCRTWNFSSPGIASHLLLDQRIFLIGLLLCFGEVEGRASSIVLIILFRIADKSQQLTIWSKISALWGGKRNNTVIWQALKHYPEEHAIPIAHSERAVLKLYPVVLPLKFPYRIEEPSQEVFSSDTRCVFVSEELSIMEYLT